MRRVGERMSMANLAGRIGGARAARAGYARALVSVALMAMAVAGVVMVAAMPARREKPKETERRPVRVTVETVEPIASFAETVNLPAVIEPTRVVTVSAEVPGRIERLPAQKGRPVKAGELLAVLNTDLLKADYDRAQAQATFDASEHARVLKLRTTNVVTDKDLDLTRSQMAISRAALEQASARLARAKITAPISGVLNKIPVEKGEYVTPGDPVAEIVDIAKVKAVVWTPEKDVQFLKTGGEEEVITDVRGRRKTFQGRLSYISELANAETRSSRVEIELDNRRRELRSGQIALVRMTLRRLKDVILIPLAAVIPQENGHTVYIAADGKAERRIVKLGFFRGRRVRAMKPDAPKGAKGLKEWQGLKAGDKLIVAGHRFVGPGQSVEEVGPDGDLKKSAGAKALSGVER